MTEGYSSKNFITLAPVGETLEDHDGRNEEQLLADVEHELGGARRHKVDHVLDGRHVALAAIDLPKNVNIFKNSSLLTMGQNNRIRPDTDP